MITIIDNYDSFTYNLVQQIERLSGGRLNVLRNDEFDPAALLATRPQALVISPGPGTPDRAGRVPELIRLHLRPQGDRDDIPLLGVCLGHQAIGEAVGARVVLGPLPVHGKVSPVLHGGKRLFAGCPVPLESARYHSLVVDRLSIPEEFVVDAETADGTVMAMSHKDRPIFGIQFHPESYGTVGGDVIITNFLAYVAGQPRAQAEDRSGQLSTEVRR